jgi:arabinan endo-1,5-alpha-L-arabinosidase
MEEMGKRNVMVHDPSTIVKCKDEYWVYCTAGRGVGSRHSKDLIHWTNGVAILTQRPEWLAAAVPANTGGFWAPDVTYLKDKYLLYFAASTFGKRTSAIGLATSPTLDQMDPNHQWTHQGIVFQTHDANPADPSIKADNFNAIDPAIIVDGDKLWLCFGSFWDGIKLIELNPATGLRITPDSPVYGISESPKRDTEASYIYKHGDYYYLFVNWGKCCSGVASTYKIMVGRGKKITGPYVDKDGKDMAKGGGTLFLGSEGDFIGPGHAGVIEADGKFWFSCHFYDGSPGSSSAGTLATRTMHWDADAWPQIEPKQNYVAENTRVAPPARGRGRGRAATAPATTTATPASTAATSAAIAGMASSAPMAAASAVPPPPASPVPAP